MDVIVTAIQRFCPHDGPGVRTVVFLKGCPLRCKWCHNPETAVGAHPLYYRAEKCIGCGACAACPEHAHVFGETHFFERAKCIGCGACAQVCPTGALENSCYVDSVENIVGKVLADAAFYGVEGGVTVSGGEPMLHPENALAILRGCKEKGIGTAIETCGYFGGAYLRDLKNAADLALWDIKLTDRILHERYTGVSNDKILENLRKADELGLKTVLRCILLAGVNDNGAHYDNIAKIFGGLKNCIGAEILPYHDYGAGKAGALGARYEGKEEWTPSADATNEAKRYLQSVGVTIRNF